MREKREVIKHSAAIHIQSNITLLQRRAWNVLLANAYDELVTSDEHAITIKDLVQILEFDSKKDEYLQEALRALTTCAVEWDLLGKDGEKEWGVTTLLAQAKVRDGVCIYAYSPELRRRLHNPRMYARISLSMQNKFESKHAQTLWEVCVDYLDETRNSGETPFIALETYRKLMGIADNMYPEFKAFNRRVIKEPIDEINRVTDFHVEVVYQRKARQVTAVKFKVRRVLLLSGQVTKQDPLFPNMRDGSPAVTELKKAGLSIDEAWRIWQEGFNYVEADKRPVVADEDAELAFARYVREKIHLTHRLHEQGRVRSLTGFLLEALKKNYSNPEFVEEEKQQAAQQKDKEKKARDRQRQELADAQRELEKVRDNAIHEQCKLMLDTMPQIIEQSVMSLCEDNPTFRQYYDRAKSLTENYAVGPRIWVFVDQQVRKLHPEHFQTILDTYESKLAVLGK
jgi:hypothetical protein